MKKYNLIIASTIVLFIICGFFLAYTGTKALNPSNSKTWWTVYFTNPKSNNFNFSIENHSTSTSFHWEIISGSQTLQQGDEKISNNQTKNIATAAKAEINKKISVVVTSEKDKKEIYKNF